MVRVAVLVSGGGTNLQALIDSEQGGLLGQGRLALCLSSRSDAFALTRASKAGLATAVLSPRDFPDLDSYGKALLSLLAEYKIQVVVLAGFMTLLPPLVIDAFPDKILNVHPSLIPSFCGEGFYGLRVHEAALEKGVKVTGATVHLVSDVVDGGKILLQKAVLTEPDDTPQSLQQRVMQQAEWVLLPQAVKLICDGMEVIL